MADLIKPRAVPPSAATPRPELDAIGISEKSAGLIRCRVQPCAIHHKARVDSNFRRRLRI
jgi:hypothetical protein